MSSVVWFGVASASDSGSTNSISQAKAVRADCQPKLSIMATPNGANKNCPSDPAAVPAPSATPRRSFGKSLPNADSTRLNEQPDRPKPIRTPALRLRASGVCEYRMAKRPATYINAPTQITRKLPNRSAIAPASGWPIPHNRF
jgi:hypothetical protein